MSEPPDCVLCGACCYTTNPFYVGLGPEDVARLAPGEAERLTFTTPEGTFMRLDEGHCGALDAGGGRFLCSIYDRRPQVCRDFGRGGAGCTEARLRTARNLAVIGRGPGGG